MKRVTYQEFLEKAVLLYGDKYDYSKVIYINTSTKFVLHVRYMESFGLHHTIF